MRLLKSNLEELSNNLGIQTPNITFPQLPNDNRLRLVPKDSENEKQIMYKEGDKMRIPGVLDYTGAKYPFKKLVKKAQQGTSLDEIIKLYQDDENELPIVDPNYEIPEYMINNPYYSSKAPSKESLIFDDDVTYYYQNIIPEKLRKLRGNFNYDYIKNIPFNNTAFYPDAYNYISDAYYSDPENQILGVTEPDFLTNEITVTLNPILKGNTIGTHLSHEYAHVMQMLNNLQQKKKINSRANGYTPQEIKTLIDAYDMSGYKMKLNPDQPEIELDRGQILSEIGAVNTNIAFDLMTLFKDKYNKYPSLSELNNFIRNEVPKETVIELLRNSAYGEYMFGKGSDSINDSQYEKILKALTEVASNNINNKSITYAKSGIKIKKKNRGKFTDYCGGNVTQECINRAKKSGNKTLIKRATFAENARHFKHKFGGQIVQDFKSHKME